MLGFLIKKLISLSKYCTLTKDFNIKYIAMPGQEELILFGPEEIIVIVSGILLLILLITFFVMAHRLKRIKNILVFFQRLENRKPENWIQIHCKNCHYEFKVSKGGKDKVICPKCKILNPLPIR